MRRLAAGGWVNAERPRCGPCDVRDLWPLGLPIGFGVGGSADAAYASGAVRRAARGAGRCAGSSRMRSVSSASAAGLARCATSGDGCEARVSGARRGVTAICEGTCWTAWLPAAGAAGCGVARCGAGSVGSVGAAWAGCDVVAPSRPRRARMRAVLARISPMRSIRLASLPIGLPPSQYRADVAPLAFVLLRGLTEGRLDPVPRIASARVA